MVLGPFLERFLELNEETDKFSFLISHAVFLKLGDKLTNTCLCFYFLDECIIAVVGGCCNSPEIVVFYSCMHYVRSIILLTDYFAVIDVYQHLVSWSKLTRRLH